MQAIVSIPDWYYNPGKLSIGEVITLPNGVEERQTVVLAAFLHDIGKLLGRSSSRVLDKGQHPKYSADFISAHRDVFSSVSDVDLLHELVQKQHESRGFPPELRVDSVTDEHSRTLARLVSKADNLNFKYFEG